MATPIIEFDHHNPLRDHNTRKTWFYRSDMTVASTSSLSCDEIYHLDGRMFYVSQVRGLNAAGDVVYIDVQSSTTKPSWIP
jgi:hypothetical protein